MLHSKVRKERVTELHPVHTKTAARARLLASLASDVSKRLRGALVKEKKGYLTSYKISFRFTCSLDYYYKHFCCFWAPPSGKGLVFWCWGWREI